MAGVLNSPQWLEALANESPWFVLLASEPAIGQSDIERVNAIK